MMLASYWSASRVFVAMSISGAAGRGGFFCFEIVLSMWIKRLEF